MFVSEAEKRERRYQKLNFAVIPLYLVAAGGALAGGLLRRDMYAAAQAALGLVMLPIPLLIDRLLHFRIPQDCRLLYYVFVLGTVIVGSSLYGYSRIPYWDKIFHFLSGILISAAGLVVCQLFFHSLDGPRRTRRLLYASFPFFFNLAVAALWEIYEYSLLFFFGIDAVNHLTTGVNDTMQDIVVCLLGGLLFLGAMIWYYQKGKRTMLLGVCFQFFALREKPFEI